MICRYILFAFTLCALATSYGQTPGDSLTIEERFAAVEFQLATLDTRLNARTTVGAGSRNDGEGIGPGYRPQPGRRLGVRLCPGLRQFVHPELGLWDEGDGTCGDGGLGEFLGLVG